MSEPPVPQNQQPVIVANNLSLGYGKHIILTQVNLSIRPNEFWCFLGSNGRGKTTLLRAMFGQLSPRSGELNMTIPLSNIGFVPQRCEINSSLPTTVGEFVSLGLAGIPCSRIQRRTRLTETLQRTGLTAMARISYWALSGGQRQRTLVARALIRQPVCLIADEATNGLDPGAEQELMGLLKRLQTEQGKTVIFVTHDIRLAYQFATHVAFFRDGSVHSGPREELLTAEQLQALYGTTNPNLMMHTRQEVTS